MQIDWHDVDRPYSICLYEILMFLTVGLVQRFKSDQLGGGGGGGGWGGGLGGLCSYESRCLTEMFGIKNAAISRP